MDQLGDANLAGDNHWGEGARYRLVPAECAQPLQHALSLPTLKCNLGHF